MLLGGEEGTTESTCFIGSVAGLLEQLGELSHCATRTGRADRSGCVDRAIRLYRVREHIGRYELDGHRRKRLLVNLIGE